MYPILYLYYFFNPPHRPAMKVIYPHFMEEETNTQETTQLSAFVMLDNFLDLQVPPTLHL